MPNLKLPRVFRTAAPRRFPRSLHQLGTHVSGQRRKDFRISCLLLASLAGEPKGLSPREQGSLWTKQVPGFVLVVHASFAVAAAAEQKAGGSQEGFEGEYVPGVLGDDVGGEEMDLSTLVGNGATSDAAVGIEAIHSLRHLGSALDLDAPERRIEIDRAGGPGGDALAEIAQEGTAGILLSMRLKRAERFTARTSPLPAQRSCHAWGTGTGGGLRRRRESAGVDDYVITLAVAEGLRDSEAQGGGLEGECEFGEFTATLGDQLALAGAENRGILRDRLRARRGRASTRRLPGHFGHKKGAGR